MEIVRLSGDPLIQDSHNRECARDYIVNFMLANKDKEAILVPYHPM